MKKIWGIVLSLAVVGGTVNAQGLTDMNTYAQSELTGTARYLGVAGAFGALGGDASSISNNPAGLGVYRSSEIEMSMSINNHSSETLFNGASMKKDFTRVNFDNLAYIGYFPTGNNEGIISWNLGLSYNRLANFDRRYNVSGVQDYSLSDYTAARANGTPVGDLAGSADYDPYSSGQDWMSALGYDSGMIDVYNNNDQAYFSPFGDKNASGQWVPYQLDGADMKVREQGRIDQYNIAFGTNISNVLLLGATLSVTDMEYEYSSTYDETFVNSDYLYLDNGLKTEGSGYQVNVGAIYMPTEFFRLGVAYNSPTWYDLTDYYHGEAGASYSYLDNQGLQKPGPFSSETPRDPLPYTDYKYHTPDRFILSAAGFFGRSGFLSVDYILTNYKDLYSADFNGYENEQANDAADVRNRTAGTIRIGGEFKPTNRFSVRAGYSYAESPFSDVNSIEEIRTVGTIPSYTLLKDITNVTVGLGYRFTPQFYMDAACVLRTRKEDIFSFSNLAEVKSDPASLTTNTTKVSFTMGYKF